MQARLKAFQNPEHLIWTRNVNGIPHVTTPILETPILAGEGSASQQHFRAPRQRARCLRAASRDSQLAGGQP